MARDAETFSDPREDHIMEVTALIGRDHPVDLKRVAVQADGSSTHEHLLTLVPVKFHGPTVKICFLGRSDVDIVRAGARKPTPPESSGRTAGRFSNLAMSLKAEEVVHVGTGLVDLTLLAVGKGQVKLRIAMLAPGLLLNLEPMAVAHEPSLRAIIERLDRGEDYRTSVL